MAQATCASERGKNVNRIKDVAEDDVVEWLAELQVFRIRGQKMELGIILLRYLDQALADFDSHSVGRLD